MEIHFSNGSLVV